MNARVMQHAVAYVTGRLASGHWTVGTRLPSLSVLAAQAGVARSTMSLATQALVREGRLIGRRGSGIYVGSALPAPGPKEEGRGRVWRHARDRLAHDMVSGRFRALHALPSVKQMQEQYGVDGRTLRKALSDLQRSGMIARHRRALRITRPLQPASSSIVLLTMQDPAETQPLVTSTFALQEFVRAMEAECALAGLAFRVSSQFSAAGSRRTFADPAALGYVLWQYGPDVQRTLAVLAGERAAVAIVDDTSNSALLQEFAARNPRAFVYRFDEAGAGAAAGRLLLQRGHHRALFVSPMHNTYFSRQRFEGLRAAMLAGGGTCDICMDEETLNGLHARTLACLPSAARVALAAGREGPASRWSDLWFGRIFAAYQSAMGKALAPLFRRAAAVAHADAWVCVNDHVALAARAFLRAAKVAVPRQQGLVGFDDSTDALYGDLTSYSHNIQGLIADMLQRILAPVRRAATASTTVVHRGYMVPRGSTR